MLAILTMAAPSTGCLLDRSEFDRGALAVGDRSSDAMALRQAQMRSPSSSFRLGASWRAWRNATDSITYDAANPTGDGGDVEALAEDCSDERIAFNSIEAQRQQFGMTPDQIATMVSLRPQDLALWRKRLLMPADKCLR